jgi:membrane-associated PAP2 superfamily phosphatase
VSADAGAVGGTIPRRWLIVPLAILAALLAMEATNIDLTISHWFYDSAAHAFPLRQTFFFDTVLHHWTKYAVILATCVIVGALLLTWIIPALARWRSTLLFLALAMALAPLTVNLLKLVTDRPCPWDFIEFGGAEPYTRLLQFRGAAHARGLCFPAGHAATGFTLMAFFFVFHRERRDALARAALLAGVLAGVLLGISRIAQGAHFMSHVLWSGLVSWLVMVSLYALLFTPRPSDRTSLANRI